MIVIYLDTLAQHLGLIRRSSLEEETLSRGLVMSFILALKFGYIFSPFDFRRLLENGA
jgi:hypothetical protein